MSYHLSNAVTPVLDAPRPVILDTDIGFDVDDVWALAFMLRCPELDIKLITTTTGDTHYRARLVAKLLQIAGREDIPIGIGIPLEHASATHAQWLGDFSLNDYPGDIVTDGVGAITRTISAQSEVVQLISIGPLSNVAAALAAEPSIVHKARFIGMQGSLRRGYLGAAKPMREFNVKQYPLAAQAVFQAPWDKVITPLDTCGDLILDGERFAQLAAGTSALNRAVLDNHFGWFEAVKDWPVLADMNPSTQSSILYDTVAVYLAFSEEHLEMETLPIEVTADGKTLISDSGSPVRCATNWHNKDAFMDLLVERLL